MRLCLPINYECVYLRHFSLNFFSRGSIISVEKRIVPLARRQFNSRRLGSTASSLPEISISSFHRIFLTPRSDKSKGKHSLVLSLSLSRPARFSLDMPKRWFLL